jgi:iron(III) transport system ATP-binding protein
MTPLRIANLTKRFSAIGQPAVDQLTLEVQADEVFSLVGPSGCGKTTALRMIAGLETPDAGSIRIGDTVIEGHGVHVPSEQRQIGLVFQELALFPHLDVLHNTMFGLDKLPRNRRRDRAMEVLDWVGMADYAGRSPHELSGGQQQRVALARSISPAPSMLLLDEPFNNLDAGYRAEIRAMVRRVLKEQSMSALLVTHDQEEALSFADRIGVMNHGRLLQVGRPQQVYHQPATAFVAQFLGRTNLLDAAVTEDGRHAHTALGRICINGQSSGDVLLSIRPEHLRLMLPQSGSPAGRVVSRQFKGHDQTIEVQLSNRVYTVQTDYSCPFQVGQEVAVVHAAPAIVVEPDCPRDVQRPSDRAAALPAADECDSSIRSTQMQIKSITAS